VSTWRPVGKWASILAVPIFSIAMPQANVTEQRIQKFIDEARGPQAETSFIDYCIGVQQLNHAALV
jgi:hypothetical protein